VRSGSVLECVECGRAADDQAFGWRAYREDLPGEDDPPSVATFCPTCAVREFDGELAE
jgi:ribosomal protein L44E